MKKKLVLLLTLTLTAAVAHGRDATFGFDSLTALAGAKPLPQYVSTYKQIAAQGGPGFEQTKTAVITYIKDHLKDPDSAKAIKVALPFFNTRATIHKDWIITFTCNAKNSFGAYIGSRVYYICWRAGQIDVDGQTDFEGWGGNDN